MTEPHLDNIWFLFQEGNLAGPFNADAATQRCLSATQETMLWCAGAADWLPAAPFATAFPDPQRFIAASREQLISWHYAQDETSIGPIPEPALRQLLQGGSLSGKTLVWHQGLSTWQTAATFPRLLTVPPLPDRAQTLRCAHCGQFYTESDGLFHAGNFCCAACKTPYFAALAEQGEFRVNTRQPGGVLLRLAAKILDGLILYVLCLPFNLLHLLMASAWSKPNHEFFPLVPVVVLIVNFLSLLLQLIYTGYFLSTRGATPGKLLLKLQVIRSDGRPLSFWRGVCRGLAESFGAMLCGIGYLMILTNAEKCGLHDYMCDTRVIKKP